MEQAGGEPSNNGSDNDSDTQGEVNKTNIEGVLEESVSTFSVSSDDEVCNNSAEVVVHVASSEGSVVAAAGDNDCQGDNDSLGDDDCLMPAEQLDSDSSDIAGFYQVNTASADQSDAVNEPNNPSYQRGTVSSASSDTDDESDSDLSPPSSDSDMSDTYFTWRITPRRRDTFRRRMERWLATGSRSPSPSINGSSPEDVSGDETDESCLPKTKVKITHNILSDTQSRSLGDFGHQRNHLAYSSKLRGNLSVVQKMRCVGTLDAHHGCVNALNFNMSGTYLASGSDDRKVVIWNMHTYQPYITFKSGHTSNVFQAKFMPHSNDSQIVTCGRDGQVRVAELSVTGSCKETREVVLHAGSAHKLAVETDPAHCLLSAGEDGVVFQVDLRVRKPTKLVEVRQNDRKVALYSIDKHANNSYEFLVCGRDHFVRVYDKRFIGTEGTSDGILKKFVPSKFSQDDSVLRDVTCAVYNYNGSEIVATYNGNDIYLFNNELSEPNDEVMSYTGHRNISTVKGVNFFGPKSEYIVSGSDCGNVFFWDKLSIQPVQIQKGDREGVVNVLEPHPHLPYLAVSGLDHSVKYFMPVGKKPTSLSKYKEVMQRNISRNSRSSDRRLFIMRSERLMNWMDSDPGATGDEDNDDSSSDDDDRRLDCLLS